MTTKRELERELDRLRGELDRQITARRAVEQLLADKGRETRELSDLLGEKRREAGELVLLDLLMDAGGMASAAPKVIRVLCEMLDWEIGVFWWMDEGAKELTPIATWTPDEHQALNGDFLRACATLKLRVGSDLPGEAWERKEPRFAIDLGGEVDSPRRELARDCGIHATVAFPLGTDARVFGVAEFLSREFRVVNRALLSRFDGIGRHLARFLDLQDAKAVLRQRELSIARRVQTSILPHTLEVPGLQLAAKMLPAEEVGGDYFDVLPQERGCWVGIGDVTGHGLGAGIIMLMVQSGIASLVGAQPDACPSRIVSYLNRMLHQNIRRRLSTGDHVTLSLLRYDGQGSVTFAGAHEDIIVYRNQTGVCEQIRTPGPWLGVVADISSAAIDTTINLRSGDVIVLYTDGLTEAMNADRTPFGIERVCEIVAAHHHAAPSAIRDRLFDAVSAFAPQQADDVTVIVARYLGGNRTS